MAKNELHWLPLESNPDVLNKFVKNLGMDTSKFQFCDVYGTDPGLLAMVPQPAMALLLLFPISEASNASDAAELDNIDKNGQTVSKNVWFMKQTIGNACGTIGVLHAIANNQETLGLSDDSPLQTFFKSTSEQSPQEKAATLESAKSLAVAHKESGQEGQTKPPEPDEIVTLHFIAFVEKDGHVYELDGRKPYPINHGPTSKDNFLADAAKVADSFIKRDPKNHQFSMLALAPPPAFD